MSLKRATETIYAGGRVRSMIPGLFVRVAAALAPAGCGDGAESVSTPVLGLGGVEVAVVVTGPVYGTEPLNIILTLNGVDVPGGTVAPTGGMIRLSDLPTGDQQLRLQPAPRGCRITTPNPLSVKVEDGAISVVVIAIDCSIVSSEIFERVTPYSAGSGLNARSEHYRIRPDGTFLLHYEYVDFGPGEGPGTWSLAGTEIILSFDWPGWAAHGTLLGNCLTVTYGTLMRVDGFENGEYCR